MGKNGFGLLGGLIGNTMNSRRSKQLVPAMVMLLALSQIATAQWSEGLAIASDAPSEPLSSATGETDFLQAMKNHLAAYQEELDATNSHESMRANNLEQDAQQRDNQRQSRFDAAVIRRGQQFFQSSCTQCHDAERATSKRKSYSAWLATVRRMAAREDADIPANEHVPIATYLASLNPANQPSKSGGGSSGDDAAGVEAQLPPFTLNGTLSTVWRGTDNNLENRGFFPDVWLGVEWRAPENPVSG